MTKIRSLLLPLSLSAFLLTLIAGCSTPSHRIPDSPDLDGQFAASMSHARGTVVLYTMLDGRILVVGSHKTPSGSSHRNKEITTSEIYNPQLNQWQQLTDVPLRIFNDAIIDPMDRDTLGLLSSCSFAFYNIKENTWSEEFSTYYEYQEKSPEISCLTSDRVQIGNNAYMTFGNSSYLTKRISIMSLEPRVHRPAGEMSVLRSDMAMVTMNKRGEVFAAGGYAGDKAVFDTTEIYHPGTRQWRQVAPMLIPISDATALVLQDGRIMVVGAHNYIDPPVELNQISHPHPGMLACEKLTLPSNTAQIYDPATDTWTWAAPPSCNENNKDRWLRHALVLQDGRVLTVWANDAQTRIYTPANDKWSNGPVLSIPRASGGAVLEFADGKVMFAGGANNEGEYLNTVEILTP